MVSLTSMSARRTSTTTKSTPASSFESLISDFNSSTLNDATEALGIGRSLNQDLVGSDILLFEVHMSTLLKSIEAMGHQNGL
jgi:hypothetical protein